VSATGFDSGTELGRIDAGTSILLTGDDEAVLSDLFYRLVAAGEDERSVVLATDSRGRLANSTRSRPAPATGRPC